jgi:predicted secreted protein
MAINTNLASVSFGAVTILGVGSYSFTNERSALETTEIGSTTRSYISGIQGASASIEIFYDQAQASHATLEGYIGSGTIATLIVTNSSSQTYTASAILTRFEITGQAGDLVRASCDFQITGAVTIA